MQVCCFRCTLFCHIKTFCVASAARYAAAIAKRPGTGGERFKNMYNNYNEEICRRLTIANRPAFFPSPIATWLHAQSEVLSEIQNMEDIMLATFILPIHLLFGVTDSNWAMMLSHAVSL